MMGRLETYMGNTVSDCGQSVFLSGGDDKVYIRKNLNCIFALFYNNIALFYENNSKFCKKIPKNTNSSNISDYPS